MALTLESIARTLGIGLAVMALCFFLFGWALKARSIRIAPRASSRPRNVIHNPHPQHFSQDRGSAWIGWIPWTLRLSYDRMLKGVPGTGTREGGVKGMMLKVNFDGIVLLHFNNLCRRVAIMGALLFNLILLPIYYTARCTDGAIPDDEVNEYGNSTNTTSAAFTCSTANYNLTNYMRTTIMNVPTATSTGLDDYQRDGFIGRLFATSFVFFFFVLYILHLLEQNWITMLAMRRVFYLEHDIWGERRKELEDTLLYDATTPKNNDVDGTAPFFYRDHQSRGVSSNNEESNGTTKKEKTSSERHLVDRPPWIPHPEQRETVPNVSLYSVLVGGLPSIPDNLLIGMEDSEEKSGSIGPTSRRINIDWQLEMTTKIFDMCVPNQPGFSSSVAAVTIIPGAHDVSEAWRKWYIAASKMRRLQYIRKQIAKLREYDDIDVEFGTDHSNNSNHQPTSDKLQGEQVEIENGFGANQNSGKHKESYEKPQAREKIEVGLVNLLDSDYEDSTNYDSAEEFQSTSHDDDRIELDRSSSSKTNPKKVLFPSVPAKETEKSPEDGGGRRTIYRGLSKKKSYYRQVFGSPVEVENEAEISVAIKLGPEQAAVYSRELAQSAAACCPFGCRDGRIRNAQLEDLIEMERKAEAQLRDANQALKQIRREIAVLDEVDDDNAQSSSHSKAKKSVAFDECHLPEDHDLQLEARIFKRDSKNDMESKPKTDANRNRKDSKNLCFRSGFKASKSSASRNLWNDVETIINDTNPVGRRIANAGRIVDTGEWHRPSFNDLKQLNETIRGFFTNLPSIFVTRSSGAVNALARSSTYAVVTFTSRQAAVAARMCLADGRGCERWQTIQEIPIPPLADAAPGDILAFRNCCRPVTISINTRQKSLRKYMSIGLLACIYVFWTIPLTVIANLAKPSNLAQIAPGLGAWMQERGVDPSGYVTAVMYSVFFSLCPIMFKSISNFGSGAHSIAQAEYVALQYYWWFMVLTAFSSTLLGTMVINAFNNDVSFESQFREVLVNISLTIPETIAFTWLNWIILRFTTTIPLSYLLQINNFIFGALGLKCCARLVAGGGAGGPANLRIYIDAGVVLLCILALGPASPLVSLAGLAYFIVLEPILRRNLIFVYRPDFDAGGARWIFLFDMTISAIVVGVILLTTQMILKAALGPAVVAALTIVPTFMYQSHAKQKYKPAFADAALLQTALLDGWDATPDISSREQREEFRQWLVDAHKAAYIPVCMFGKDTIGCLTAEPAVTLPVVTEPGPGDESKTKETGESLLSVVFEDSEGPNHTAVKPKAQVGAIFRRAAHNVALMRKVSFPASRDVESQSLRDDNVSLMRTPLSSSFSPNASMAKQD